MLDQFLKTSTPTPHQTGRLSTSHISHRERDDAYLGTIVQFSPRWRLILCKDQMQWIIQKKESSRRGDWRAERYLTSRDSLIETCGKRGFLSDPNVDAVLRALPDHVSQLAKK